jgi:hypothetical protein
MDAATGPARTLAYGIKLGRCLCRFISKVEHDFCCRSLRYHKKRARPSCPSFFAFVGSVLFVRLFVRTRAFCCASDYCYFLVYLAVAKAGTVNLYGTP